MRVYTHKCQCSWEPEALATLQPEVDHELSDVGAGDQPQILWRSTSWLSNPVTLPSRTDDGQGRVNLADGIDRLRREVLGDSIPALGLKVCPGHRLDLWKVKED